MKTFDILDEQLKLSKRELMLSYLNGLKKGTLRDDFNRKEVYGYIVNKFDVKDLCFYIDVLKIDIEKELDYPIIYADNFDGIVGFIALKTNSDIKARR